MNTTQLFDDAPVMLWSARPDLSCDYINAGGREFIGYSRDEALGECWARAVHPEDLPRWLELCVRAFDTRQSYDVEYRLRRRDGVYRWVLERARPRFAPDGAFLGYVGACVDIDDRKRAECGLAAVARLAHRAV